MLNLSPQVLNIKSKPQDIPIVMYSVHVDQLCGQVLRDLFGDPSHVYTNMFMTSHNQVVLRVLTPVFNLHRK